MAAKSTFLQQVALIVLMAQVGSLVPACRAGTGMADKMFSCMGASADLTTGRSASIVGMLQASANLNQATDRSLVILDKVGRGTSTHDGLAIAQAGMEQLHECRRPACRTSRTCAVVLAVQSSTRPRVSGITSAVIKNSP